jgi:hypothetical protein
MVFHKSVMPFPPMVLQSGSSDAERIGNAPKMAAQKAPLAMTREESERKQLASEARRATWREEIGLKDV